MVLLGRRWEVESRRAGGGNTRACLAVNFKELCLVLNLS